ncbi:MAG TPA: hypothetical protein VL728_06310 [Cyclobacteriaceae bacterium]|jgi:hypothetical protein|nr:hypothetical protein [Cyclobacteriaceae bacterium]
MKNFSKLVFTSLFVLAMAPAFSQFSAGLDLALPNGNFSDAFNVGFGVSGRYEAPIASVDKLNWTASAGFISFSGKSYTYFAGFNPSTGQPMYATEKIGSVTAIPLQGGVKYYFKESNAGFYAAGDIGLVIFSGSGNSSNKFVFAPGIGYRLEKFDFAFRYNSISDASFLGLRAAYIFPGK